MKVPVLTVEGIVMQVPTQWLFKTVTGWIEKKLEKLFEKAVGAVLEKCVTSLTPSITAAVKELTSWVIGWTQRVAQSSLDCLSAQSEISHIKHAISPGTRTDTDSNIDPGRLVNEIVSFTTGKKEGGVIITINHATNGKGCLLSPIVPPAA